jgi:hypothetical protein
VAAEGYSPVTVKGCADDVLAALLVVALNTAV